MLFSTLSTIFLTAATVSAYPFVLYNDPLSSRGAETVNPNAITGTTCTDPGT
jgi:hypothetical protein